MTMALDVGAKQFRSLKRAGSRLIAKTYPAACCFLPEKPSVRHLLETAGVPFVRAGEQLVIWGESAEKLSQDCAVKTEHLLVRNPLRKDRPSIAAPLNEIVTSLLPPASSPEEICCVGSIREDRHADWLEAEVHSRGYRIGTCSAGLALVLAEMVRENFTGIGFVFGASRSEAVLVREGRQIARWELPRGGEAIDESIALSEDRYWWSLAGFRELQTDGITAWRESLDASVLKPANPRGERLLSDCHQLVGNLIVACETSYPQDESPEPMAVIAGGGLARMPGFFELLKQHLAESTLPIDSGKIRLAPSNSTIARGLLIFAELEQRRGNPAFAA